MGAVVVYFPSVVVIAAVVVDIPTFGTIGSVWL